MTAIPIVTAPNTVLTTPTKTVSSFDRKLAATIEDMKMSLLDAQNPKGVGLAAPQIGVPLRVFVTKPTEKSKIRVFVNPEITNKEGEVDGVAEHANKLEGCLSIPAIWGKVKRNKTVVLKYQDEKGKVHEQEFSGFMATIVQHETDHVNGILFTQRVLEQKGKLYQSIVNEEGKEVLEEVII